MTHPTIITDAAQLAGKTIEKAAFVGNLFGLAFTDGSCAFVDGGWGKYFQDMGLCLAPTCSAEELLAIGLATAEDVRREEEEKNRTEEQRDRRIYENLKRRFEPEREREPDHLRESSTR